MYNKMKILFDMQVDTILCKLKFDDVFYYKS